MKNKHEWSVQIMKFLQSSPVSTLEAAKAQIETIVEWVQKDALENSARALKSKKKKAK